MMLRKKQVSRRGAEDVKEVQHLLTMKSTQVVKKTWSYFAQRRKVRKRIPHLGFKI
jgi:hypothetical protein